MSKNSEPGVRMIAIGNQIDDTANYLIDDARGPRAFSAVERLTLNNQLAIMRILEDLYAEYNTMRFEDSVSGRVSSQDREPKSKGSAAR